PIVLENSAKSVDCILYRFATRSYIAQDVFGSAGDLSKPMGYGIDAAHPDEATTIPVPRGHLFRGSEQFIAERQRIYLSFFRGFRRVVDLGCGRGEFLRLLAESQIPALGVELNSALIPGLRAQGLEVVEGDAVDYLRGLPEGSLDGIFSAQVIEHLDPKELPMLLM